MCDDFVNLAYKANLTVEKFLEFNDMTDKDAVQIGQVFYIESKKVFQKIFESEKRRRCKSVTVPPL